jgi:hypothetical protein
LSYVIDEYPHIVPEGLVTEWVGRERQRLHHAIVINVNLSHG